VHPIQPFRRLRRRAAAVLLMSGLVSAALLGAPQEDTADSLQQACDLGDAKGCYKLGLKFAKGESVPKDDAKAVSLLQKACDGGDVMGCNDLGFMYGSGRGVPKDDAKAVQFYQKACDGGHSQSCHNLGVMYASGRGVPTDTAKAFQLYQRACDGGYAGGCNNLGQAYANGWGVQKDVAEAVRLYKKACDGGSPAGCRNLATHTGAPNTSQPTSIGAMYYLDSSGPTLKPLPKEAAQVVSGLKGLTGVKASVRMPGMASSFRLTSGKDLEFVISCSNPESIALYAFTPKGKDREAMVATAKGGLGKRSVQQVGTIPVYISRYGESSYRFTVKAPEPGEYGFVMNWSVFDFAIDPKIK